MKAASSFQTLAEHLLTFREKAGKTHTCFTDDQSWYQTGTGGVLGAVPSAAV